MLERMAKDIGATATKFHMSKTDRDNVIRAYSGTWETLLEHYVRR